MEGSPCVLPVDGWVSSLPPCSRSEAEVKAAAEKGELMATVGQDNRLNNRFLDLRTPANQAIFKIQSGVCQVGPFVVACCS